jgi:hypothetical protein
MCTTTPSPTTGRIPPPGSLTRPIRAPQLALLLASGFQGAHPWLDNHVSDVSWDGVIALGSGTNPYDICAHDNGSGHFANLHFQQWQAAQAGSPTPVPLGNFLTFDDRRSACTLPALPAVTLPAF